MDRIIVVVQEVALLSHSSTVGSSVQTSAWGRVSHDHPSVYVVPSGSLLSPENLLVHGLPKGVNKVCGCSGVLHSTDGIWFRAGVFLGSILTPPPGSSSQ